MSLLVVPLDDCIVADAIEKCLHLHLFTLLKHQKWDNKTQDDSKTNTFQMALDVHFYVKQATDILHSFYLQHWLVDDISIK